MSEFVRVLKTTISDYLKGEEMNVLKNQKLTALLQQKQRISYNHSGNSHTWVARAARNKLQPYTDAQAMSFPRVNRNQMATLPWRGYVLPEAITLKEKLMNRGKEALVNYASNLGEMMVDDLKYGFNGELYIDGTTTANADRIYGIQSFSSYTSGNTAQYPLSTATYGGLSCAQGSFGGAASAGSTWPIGTFDPLYYFWTPLIVSYTNAAWGASTENWANNCLEALRFGTMIQQNLKGKSQKVDLYVMEVSMLGNVKDAFAAKERIQIQRGGETSGLVKVGFTDVVNFDGVDITSEADCPANQAFGICFDCMELLSMQKQLFDLEDMDDLNTLSQKLVAVFMGNTKFNPRGFVFLTNAG